MAEPLDYDVTPPPNGPNAQQELDQLVQTLHEHGVLRFANDVVASNHELLKILLGGLNNPGTLNALQNLSSIAMAFSTVPPERFHQVMFALKEGMEQMSRERHPESAGDPAPQTAKEQDNRSPKHRQEKDGAPGITGLYKMLNDDDLWYTLSPLMAGLRAFSARLDRPVDKPVTDFTGKPTEGP
ncbi:DUF1641 domain-containing protein [Vreelandella sp. EE22]